MCRVQVRECGFSASWRSRRLTHWELMARTLQHRGKVSPLFRTPWLVQGCFRIDWLHVADQGVSADFVANVLLTVARKGPARALSSQVQLLWEKLLAWYERKGVVDRLPRLVPTTLQQPKKAPKVRGSAAQVRALIPFALECSQELLSLSDPIESAIRIGMHHLHQCYVCLDSECFSSDVLQDSAVRFAQQYVALEAQFPESKSWRIKPKLHLFLELTAEGSRPSQYWCYRDEDWGGSVARMARRRGGRSSVANFSASVLQRFRVQQPAVRMLKT